MKKKPKIRDQKIRATTRSTVFLGAVNVNLEASADGPNKHFSMTAYSGGPLFIKGFEYPVVVDLNGVSVGSSTGQVNITLDHKDDQRVGHTTKVEVNPEGIFAEGLTSAETTARKEVIESAANGFGWQASIEGRVFNTTTIKEGRSVRVNNRTFPGPVIVARRFVLSAISFVTSGGDEANEVYLAAQQGDSKMSFAEWLKALGIKEEDLSDEGRKVLEERFKKEEQTTEASGTESTESTESKEPTQAEPSNPAQSAKPVAAGRSTNEPENTVSRIRREVVAEEDRIAGIRKLCANRYPNILAKAIGEGWDLARTEITILRAEREQHVAIHAESSSDGPNRGDVLVASLCASAGLNLESLDFEDNVCQEATRRENRNVSIHSLLYDTIHAAGRSVRPGPITDDVIRTAMEADRSIRAAGEGFSTVSISGTLGNVANKTLLAAYNAVPMIASQVCAVASKNDFKQHTSYRVTTQGLLLELGPDGEIKHTELSETPYVQQLKTYARMLALTRQDMINDDLGALTRLAQAFGRVSAKTVDYVFHSVLLANAGSFFGTGNGNYWAHADSALDIGALTTVAAMFIDFEDDAGHPMMVDPAILLVSKSNKVMAEQLYNDLFVNETTTAGKPKPSNNPHVGNYRPVTSPWLSKTGLFANASDTGWYLIADPNDLAFMELAYLRGQSTPTIESSDTVFNTLGMQWRAYHDFGLAFQDPSGAVFAKGTA